MTTDPLDPRATDADSLLRQERSEPVAIPIDNALRALHDVARQAIEQGASVPFAICLTNAIDRLRLAIERARDASDKPLDAAAALADIAARVLALPHGGSPSVYLGSSAEAFDTLRVNDGTITQSPRKEERADLMCVLVVDGVEFYAIDRRPR